MLLSVMAAMVLGLAGCGSSSSSSSPSTSSSPASGGGGGTTPGGTPILVGNIGSYSGSQAGSLGGAERVINAWADAVNAAGGIAGHPVKLIVKDDAGNQTTGVVDVKQLIADHVVAIVGQQSLASPSWAADAASAGVPVVGGLITDSNFLTNQDFFPAGANEITMIYGMIANAKTFGPKVAFLYCAEAPACATGNPLIKAISAAQGEQPVYFGAVSASAPDYTAVCASVKASGAQSYEIADAADIVQRIAAACAQQGVTAKLLAIDGTLSASWARNPSLSGTLSAEGDFPFVDSSVPATQAYQAAIAKYAPGLGDANGPNASYAWVSGKLFEEAAKAIPQGTPVTSAAVKAGLYTLKDDTLGGLAPPLTFTSGQQSSVDCYFKLAIAGGKFVEPDGLNTTCAPDSLIRGIIAKL